MSKITVKKVPEEEVYYDWQEEVYLEEVKDDLVIVGERNWICFGRGNAVDIIKGDYYDESLDDPYDYDVYEELNKVCGGDWDMIELTGYSQGDYAYVYFNKKKVDQWLLDDLDVFLMGKVDEFYIEDKDNDDLYHAFIPHDVVWDGKEAICKYLGLDPNDTIVLEPDGYKKVYNYKEVE